MASLADSRGGSVIAVHVNYRSRAAQRGRTPAHPSYFLKPSSSLAVSGDPVRRPPGCELLTFEGEVALIIGERARRVPPADAWSHVAYVTAANDFGVYDLRHADLGSNLRAKGIDGYTPLGPRRIPADRVDPARLTLRTWVNGELVQEAALGAELLFGLDLIVADLSRLMTLHPGDIILTGTPAGSTVVAPGDVVEVEVDAGPAGSSGRLITPIEQDDHPLAPIGAMPAADEATRMLAYGGPSVRAATVDARTLEALGRLSTATLSSQLRKRGLNGCTLSGIAAVRPDNRFVGRAKTVQYLPLREDLFAERGGGYNAQKRAVDGIGPGEVLVISARGERDAGTIGDILVLRAQARGAAAVVTDGAIRDHAAIREIGLPVYAAGAHPAVLGRRHVPWQVDVPVACGGVLIEPGDVLVGDGDGVVVVPEKVAAEVARDAGEQELEERFITEQVAAGHPIEGLYPVTSQWRAAYEGWRAGLEST